MQSLSLLRSSSSLYRCSHRLAITGHFSLQANSFKNINNNINNIKINNSSSNYCTATPSSSSSQQQQQQQQKNKGKSAKGMTMLKVVVTITSVGVIYMTSKGYIADSLTSEALDHYRLNGKAGLERTEALLKMALMVAPTNYASHMALGDVLLDNRREPDAEKVFTEALAASKTDIQSYWAHDILAELCLLRGSLEEAYVHLKLMEKNPILNTPAAATLPPATSRNVSPDLIKARMAILAILQAHEAEASKYINQLQGQEEHSINAGLASMMTYYGFELWAHDKLDLAHRIYSKAADLNPDPTTLLNLAISYKEHLKDNKKYLELVQKVEETIGKSDKPEDLKQLNRTLTQLKKYWLEQKNMKMAFQYMQKIDAIVPNDNVNVCDMAIIQRQNGRYKESAALLERVLEARPTNKKCLMELAITKALMGNKQEARDLAAKSGREKIIWIFVGEHYLKNRDKRKAADAFQEALNLHPEDPELLEKIKLAK